MHSIGFTGEIGTGKSLIADILRKKGFEVIDLEEISNKVLQPGQQAYKQIREFFGDRFFDDENGGVFLKEKLLALLSKNNYVEMQNEYLHMIDSAIYHETVRQMLRQTFRVKKLIFLVIPHGMDLTDSVLCKKIFITCDKEVQIQRVMSRDGISEEKALEVINAKIPTSNFPRKQRQKESDLGKIENNNSIEEFEQKVDDLIKDLKSKTYPFVVRLIIGPSVALSFGAVAYSLTFLMRAFFKITRTFVDPILDRFERNDELIDELDVPIGDDDDDDDELLEEMELYFQKVKSKSKLISKA